VMSDPLLEIYDRLIRAQEHFEIVEAELLAYYSSDFGALSGEFDPGDNGRTGGFVVRGHIAWPSNRVHTIIGELLHNLLSAPLSTTSPGSLY